MLTETHPVTQNDRTEGEFQTLGENTAVIARIKHSRPNVGQSDKAVKTHPFRLKAGRGVKTTKTED